MSVPEQQKGKVDVKPIPTPVSIPAPQAVRLQARIDTAYSTDWTQEEQVALDATLDRFPAGRHTPLERYVRAAAALPKKGVRDVALRVIWLASNATKRRAQDDSTAKKRPRIQSIFAVQPKGAAPIGGQTNPGYPPPAAQVPVPGVVEPTTSSAAAAAAAGGGPMAQLLEQNYQILNQYKQNMQQYKVHENTELLVRFRDNILTILGQMSSMSGLMQHMPPLPVHLNQELANSFLPKAGSSMYAPTAQPGHTGGFRVSSDLPSQMQMSVAPVVPVTSAAQANASSKSQDTKASSGRSKSKSGLKRGASGRAEEKAEERPRPDHLRSSARRAALKATPAKSEHTRSSARIAAASDSGQS